MPTFEAGGGRSYKLEGIGRIYSLSMERDALIINGDRYTFHHWRYPVPGDTKANPAYPAVIVEAPNHKAYVQIPIDFIERLTNEKVVLPIERE